jgi:hypothetical protein
LSFVRLASRRNELAAVNASVDVVSDLGVHRIPEMPATSERIWRAIQEAQAGAAD